MPDHSQAIRDLTDAIASGVRSVNINGVQTTYNSFDEMRRALQLLKNEDDRTVASRGRRKPFNRLRLP